MCYSAHAQVGSFFLPLCSRLWRHSQSRLSTIQTWKPLKPGDDSITNQAYLQAVMSLTNKALSELQNLHNQRNRRATQTRLPVCDVTHKTKSLLTMESWVWLNQKSNKLVLYHPQTKQPRYDVTTKFFRNHGNAISTDRILQDFRKLSEKLHALLIQYGLIRMIKSDNVRRAEYESCGGETEGNRLLGGRRRRWKALKWILNRVGRRWMDSSGRE